MKMSSHLKTELAVTCSTLGRLHKGEYFIEPDCIESVKDLIRYLKRDNEAHEIRRHLGESKVLQNDLIHIIKSCLDDNPDLFDVTLRLLINLTTPAMLFYGEEIPSEKIARNIYLSLVDYSQEYKVAFCDVDFWNKICGRLTDLFEIDWVERSVDDGIQIERILMLLRNVLQVPADFDSEKRPENDITVHDKVLWALRQSQILELLLLVSSKANEEQYYLNLLEIFSLILREQNPKFLAHCEIQHSAAEKDKETEDLIKVRESERTLRNKYVNMRNFSTTFVMKGVKSLSNHDVVCHKSLEKVNEMDLNRPSPKQVGRRNRGPVESERTERRSTFTVRLFLKEFCLEFLNCSFGHLMNVVKNKLDSGKSLANDQTYYFWALKFFLDFATASDSDVDLIKNFLSSETFHFVQTNMDNALDHLNSDKKKTIDWIKRIHSILKAYRSLLETLLWMDSSKNPLTRSISREIKSQIFYVVEYREMTLHLLLLYDSTKFSLSYLRDLIETTHLFIKLLEEYSKQTKLVVQKITKTKSSKKKSKKVEEKIETREDKWEKIKDDVYDTLCSENCFPEIPPFDAALDIPIDDQKGRAMKNVQRFLHEEKINNAIGLLRCARQVWPENDYFGAEGMSVEDEVMALQEICLSDMGEVEGVNIVKDITHVEGENKEEEEEDETTGLESRIRIVEQDFDIMEYKKRLVNKKVVESCGILLKNYKNNSEFTNHCVIKLLHRIGWECCMPAMLFQASIFWTLLKIMRDKARNYEEINIFTVNLMRKFRKLASKNYVVFLELLFWKDYNVALEIQHGYEPYETKPKRSRKKKLKGEPSDDKEQKAEKEVSEDESEMNNDEKKEKKKESKGKRSKERRAKKKIKNNSQFEGFQNVGEDEDGTENSFSKNSGNLSRVLFRSDSESDLEEVSLENGNTHSGNTEKHNIDENDGKEKNELGRVSMSKGQPAESHGRSNGDCEKNKRKFHPNENSLERQKIKNLSNRKRVFIASSDEEKEDDTVGIGSENSVENLHSNKSKSVGDAEITKFKKKFQEDICQDKDSDHSSCSQTSNASSKKRARDNEKGVTTKHFYGDVDENDFSKSKRIRCIGSDSDVENFESEDERPFLVGEENRRRRLVVIDSDSDVEADLLDEK